MAMTENAAVGRCQDVGVGQGHTGRWHRWVDRAMAAGKSGKDAAEILMGQTLALSNRELWANTE